MDGSSLEWFSSLRTYQTTFILGSASKANAPKPVFPLESNKNRKWLKTAMKLLLHLRTFLMQPVLIKNKPVQSKAAHILDPKLLKPQIFSAPGEEKHMFCH